MTQILSGPGVPAPAPQNLYPSQLQNALPDAPTNYIGLPPGAAIYIPSGSNRWLYAPGKVSLLQYPRSGHRDVAQLRVGTQSAGRNPGHDVHRPHRQSDRLPSRGDRRWRRHRIRAGHGPDHRERRRLDLAGGGRRRPVGLHHLRSGQKLHDRARGLHPGATHAAVERRRRRAGNRAHHHRERHRGIRGAGQRGCRLPERAHRRDRSLALRRERGHDHPGHRGAGAERAPWPARSPPRCAPTTAHRCPRSPP